jgi:hypothetical protein
MQINGSLYKSITRSAERAGLLSNPPISDAIAVKHMPTLQNYSLLSLKLLQADSTSDIISLHKKRLIKIIGLKRILIIIYTI